MVYCRTLGPYRERLLIEQRNVESNIEAWASDQLGHAFTDIGLVRRALTHGSHKDGNYERLEFLGDRVLGCVIAGWLFSEFDEAEGELARRFAALVDKATCAEVARNIGASQHIRLDRAARASGVHKSDNTLGDVCEALIGALFVDGGMATAETFIRRGWADLIARDSEPPKDPKSALQEWAQSRRLPIPKYEVVGREGPDHNPRFRVQVTVRGFAPAEASGTSKQEAEKLAAIALLTAESQS